MIRLSPSRVNTLLTCSYSYYMSYVEKGPRGNSVPTSLGSTTHFVLECLIKPHRKKYSDQILKEGTAYCIPSISRLIQIHCDKFGISSEENLQKISGFILTALKNDFYAKGSVKIEPEHEFDIKTDLLHLYGFIDQLVFYEDKVKIVDFKSGQKPSKETIPVQALFYELIQKLTNPHLKREIEFRYLKYPRATIVKYEESSDEKLKGFEEWLIHISEYMENFTKAHAHSNFAKNNGNHFLCGVVGYKDNNEPKHLCQWKYPRVFWKLIGADGKQIESSFERAALEKKVKEGEKIESAIHRGCPVWSHEWK